MLRVAPENVDRRGAVDGPPTKVCNQIFQPPKTLPCRNARSNVTLSWQRSADNAGIPGYSVLPARFVLRPWLADGKPQADRQQKLEQKARELQELSHSTTGTPEQRRLRMDALRTEIGVLTAAMDSVGAELRLPASSAATRSRSWRVC